MYFFSCVTFQHIFVAVDKRSSDDLSMFIYESKHCQILFAILYNYLKDIKFKDSALLSI